MKRLYTLVSLPALALAAMFPVDASAVPHMTDDGYVYELNDNGTAELTRVLDGFPAASLTDIELPAEITINGTTYSLVKIGASCFKNNKVLQNITLGENVEFVGANAFDGCTALQSAKLDAKLRTIDNMAFYGCTQMGNTELNEGLDSIGHFAFWQNNNVTAARIPASVTGIGGNPWGMCGGLPAVEVDPANEYYTTVDGVLFDKDVTTLICHPIGKYNFETDRVYTVPSTVKTLLSNCMRGNAIMVECVMPEGLETIGAQTFLGCVSMTKLNIPASVSSIGNDAFLQLPKLAEFNIAEGNANYCSENGLFLTADKSTLISCLVPSAEIVVPEGVKEIKAKAFQQKNNIVSVKLASTVKRIGEQGFTSCEALETVEFNAALERIDKSAFMDCKKLTAAKLPGVLFIADYAFAHCNSLQTLEFGPMLMQIGYAAFNDCWAFKKLSIPGTVQLFGKAAFSNCQRISDLTLGEGLLEIPEGCFSTCLLLKKVEIPSTVTSIGNDAFNYNQSLEEVIFSDNIKSIGNGAFTTCNIQSVTLPDAVTSIGNLAFSNNPLMVSFTAGKSLKSIGDGAFINNQSLGSIILNEGLETIGNDAFTDTPISSIEIPASVTTIGKNAFVGCSELIYIQDNASTPQVVGGDLFDEMFDGYATVELRVPSESVNDYATADIWCKFANIKATQSGIGTVEAVEGEVESYYNLQGVRLEAPVRGLNIIRTTDGKVRKVFVK